jgi:hypothetical protein
MLKIFHFTFLYFIRETTILSRHNIFPSFLPFFKTICNTLIKLIAWLHTQCTICTFLSTSLQHMKIKHNAVPVYIEIQYFKVQNISILFFTDSTSSTGRTIPIYLLTFFFLTALPSFFFHH